MADPIPDPPIYAKIATEESARIFLTCILNISKLPTPAINKQIKIPILIISSVEKN